MTDCKRALRPSAFFDLAQQIAEDDAEALDFGYTRLREIDCAWVLCRQHVHFGKYPLFKQNVRMRSWHAGLSGPLYLRNYQIIGEEGEVLVSSTSSWVVLNLKSRTPVSPNHLSALIPAESNCPAYETEAPGKLTVPREAALEPAGTRHAAYSDVDYNSHTNNVRYISWAMDSLPEELVYARSPRDIRINFSHEVLPGGEVALFHAFHDGAWYVEGRYGALNAFTAKFEF